EMVVETEMIDDAPGKYMRLAGCDEQAQPRLAERGQHGVDIGIDAVFEQADIAEPFAIKLERAVGLCLAAEQRDKARPQRRRGAPGELVLRRHRAVEPLQRVLDRAGDPWFGVRQRAVEVEEQRGLSWHSGP